MDQKRVKILRALLFVAVMVIAARLFYIQIIQHDEYVAKAAEAHISENKIPAERGKIYVMDGEEAVPVVLNATAYAVIFDPMVVDEEKGKEVIEQYAKDKMVASWDEVFGNKESRYFVVAKDVNYANAKKIEEAEILGVSFEKQTKRVYVEGEMASEVLGFVNSDGIGQYGIEGAMNKVLSGTDGSFKSVRDVNGVALSIGDDNVKTPAVDGEDVVLSIDRNVQRKVEAILSDHVGKTPATNASAVVLDPRTGRVLAMANVPNYNPEDYGNVKDASAYQNSALEEAYETASVCKTFAFAAAIDLGVMSPNTVYNNTGSMTVDTLTFENAYKGLYGPITMQQAFNFSLNTGSATALKLISGGDFSEAGRQKLYEYYQKFGLGNYTGVELYEVPGFVPKPNEYDWTMDFTYANMTFGQGMNLTMLQVASAVAGIINNGEYHQPMIVEGKMKDGELVKMEDEKETRTVVSAATSEAMRGMLYGTREGKRTDGTDKPGYYIGGKTGTGQVVLENGKYSDALGETIASYVGFGGTEGELPQYLVMVKIWGEGQHIEGEKHATPIFNDISKYLIDYLKIPPKM